MWEESGRSTSCRSSAAAICARERRHGVARRPGFHRCWHLPMSTRRASFTPSTVLRPRNVAGGILRDAGPWWPTRDHGGYRKADAVPLSSSAANARSCRIWAARRWVQCPSCCPPRQLQPRTHRSSASLLKDASCSRATWSGRLSPSTCAVMLPIPSKHPTRMGSPVLAVAPRLVLGPNAQHVHGGGHGTHSRSAHVQPPSPRRFSQRSTSWTAITVQ
jgi:hypothetical protein